MPKPKWQQAKALSGPNVSLVQSAKQMAAACAAIGVYPRHKSFPAWEHMKGVEGMTWSLTVDGEPYWIVGINSGRAPIETVSVLVHEAVHVWQGYLEYISEESPSSEFEAYSIQAITRSLLSQYRIPK